MSISGLTVTNADATGGIVSQSGIPRLTLSNMVVSGNGGIGVERTAPCVNGSTISGNNGYGSRPPSPCR